MPTYEYACEGCGARYEKREGFEAPSRQKCPKCGKPAQRVLFAPPIVFKGSGFYKTDSRGSSGEAGPSPSSTSPGPETAAVDGGHTHGSEGRTPDTDSAPETAVAT